VGYKRAWSVFWSSVAAVGFAVALLELSVIGVLLTLGLLLLLCGLVRHLFPDASLGWPSLTVAFGILTVGSFCWVSPSLGLLVVLTAGLSSPGVVGRALGSARTPTDGREPESTPEPRQEPVDGGSLTMQEAMGPLKGLDDRQLCRLWRESFWVLRQPASPATLLCLVALREACLEELEHRDAPALQAWLDGGARASGGPEKYLAHRRR
jgi:hypothetical protein